MSGDSNPSSDSFTLVSGSANQAFDDPDRLAYWAVASIMHICWRYGWSFVRETAAGSLPRTALLALLAWLLLARARRAELVIPRIFGASRATMAWQLLVEFSGCPVAALPPTVAAVAAGPWGDCVVAGTGAVAAGVALVIAAAVPAAYLTNIRRGAELATLRGAE